MTYHSDRHHRRSIRLRGYDYSQAGAYFVIVCTKDRECLFGEVVDGVMVLNDAGRLVQTTWDSLPSHYHGVDADEFAVMPNHVHGIVVITDNDVGAGLALPSTSANRGAASSAPTLGDVVRVFKSISAIDVNRLLGRVGRPLWQRNYYEHIIRDDDSLNRIRQYIADNPALWTFDRENPGACQAVQGEAWAI